MADYQVIPDGPTAFGVKVTFPSGHGSTERGFRTEADAQAWIETQRRERQPAFHRLIDQPDGNQGSPPPRDPVQLGKLMVDILSGQVVDAVECEGCGGGRTSKAWWLFWRSGASASTISGPSKANCGRRRRRVVESGPHPERVREPDGRTRLEETLTSTYRSCVTRVYRAVA
jgi:hypothetical protein